MNKFRSKKIIKRNEKFLLITGFFMLFAVGACSSRVTPTGPIVNPTKTNTIITTPTITRTRTTAPTATGTKTSVVSPTKTGTLLPSSTQTETSSASATVTGTLTATLTKTFSATETVTVTTTGTDILTGTGTITATFTGTMTQTHTLQPTFSNTASATVSGTPSITPTATSTITPFAGNIGSVTLNPLTAYSQTTGNQFVFAYTAGDLTWAVWPSWGTLRIKIPAGWSPPSLSSSAPGAFSVAVSGGTLYGRAVSGNDIVIKVRNLQALTGTITVDYGSMTDGPGAYVEGSGLVAIPVEAVNNGDITSELATSPEVNLIPATQTITPTFTPVIGEGSIVVAPLQVVSGECGITMTFIYTAGKTAWTTGWLRIKIPAGWSAPSINPGPGHFEVASSNAVWTEQYVDGQDMIIGANGLPAFTGQIIVKYGFPGPGACVAGSGLVTVLTGTDVDGNDTYAIENSPQVMVIPPTLTITETSTITMTSTVTPTITETLTITNTHTITSSWTITETHTISPTVTVTLTQTFTPTFTVTQTSTATPTPYWKVVGYKGFSDATAEEISLYVYLGTPYICYRDTAFTNRLTLMKFAGSWSPVGNKGFTQGIAYQPSLFVNSGVPYVAFRDYNNEVNKATVMKYVNPPGWQYIDPRGFTFAAAYGPSLFVYAEMPYVIFQDAANSGKATAMFKNVAGWNNVGNPGFSSGTASSISQFIDVTTGNKYVAYRDWANGYKVTVKKLIGAVWTNVGDPGISDGGAEYVSLFVPAGGQPYVAYMDTVNDNKVTVKHFDGVSTWVTDGTAGFSAGRAEYVSLSVYGGIPSVAFRDEGNGDRAVVMKLNGSNWDLFAIVSDAAANYVRLFIDQSAGKPYVAFKDEYQGGKATVMTYEGAY